MHFQPWTHAGSTAGKAAPWLGADASVLDASLLAGRRGSMPGPSAADGWWQRRQAEELQALDDLAKGARASQDAALLHLIYLFPFPNRYQQSLVVLRSRSHLGPCCKSNSHASFTPFVGVADSAELHTTAQHPRDVAMSGGQAATKNELLSALLTRKDLVIAIPTHKGAEPQLKAGRAARLVQFLPRSPQPERSTVRLMDVEGWRTAMQVVYSQDWPKE